MTLTPLSKGSITSIPYLVATIFFALSVLHVYWAVGGQWGSGAAVPRVPSKGDADTMVKAFSPKPLGTLVVASGLALIALLVALRAGLLGLQVTHWSLQWFLVAAGVALLVRAVGDFHLVGFFKTVVGSEFARMDTLYFSPLCVLLALGLGLSAWA